MSKKRSFKTRRDRVEEEISKAIDAAEAVVRAQGVEIGAEALREGVGGEGEVILESPKPKSVLADDKIPYGLV